MTDGTRVIVRTLRGPAGKDGEVTLARLGVELEPFEERDDELQQGLLDAQAARIAHAAKTTDVHGIEVDTSVGTRVYVGGVMVYGDTGWRDVSADLFADWRLASGSGYARVRRVGAVVTVVARLERVTSGPRGGRHNITTIPAGFRPLAYMPLPGVAHLYAEGQQGLVTAYSGAIRLSVEGLTGTWSDGDQLYLSAQWPVAADSWPTSLPGTPA